MKYVITMIRHAKSKSNTGELQPHLVGDANIDLSESGHEEAVELGKKLGAKFLSTATVFCSTYLRTEQTSGRYSPWRWSEAGRAETSGLR